MRSNFLRLNKYLNTIKTNLFKSMIKKNKEFRKESIKFDVDEEDDNKKTKNLFMNKYEMKNLFLKDSNVPKIKPIKN